MQTKQTKSKSQRQTTETMGEHHPFLLPTFLVTMANWTSGKSFYVSFMQFLLWGILYARSIGNREGSYMDQTGEINAHPK